VTATPQPRCTRHLDEPTLHPCGACKEARHEFEEWTRDQELARQETERQARRLEVARIRAAIDACGLCDDQGWAGGFLCRHDPDAAERARRGIQACREALEATR
jgi:hypothetical protein